MQVTITIEMDERRTGSLYKEYTWAKNCAETAQKHQGKEPSFPLFDKWLETYVVEALETLTRPFGGGLSVRSNTLKMSDGELVDIVCRARGE